MATIAEAHVQLQPSFKGGKRKIEQEFGKPLEQQAEASGKKAANSFQSVSTAALGFAAVAGAGLFGLAKQAGSLEAAISANVQVLGDASQAVQDFAANGVEEVGLSETAVLDAATAFGQLGKIIGLSGDDLADFSIGMVEAAADMAAFKDVPIDQALTDLQSGFAGSTEVLRKYGIFLDDVSLKNAYFRETGQEVTGVLTSQQRVIATHSEILRQGADMWGQADREAGGFMRAIDNLKATVGNITADFGGPIVGFATTFLDTISGGLGSLGDFNEKTGGMLATGIAASTGLALMGAATVGIAGKVAGIVESARKFAGIHPNIFRAGLAFGALTLAVTAGFAIYGLLTQEQREIEARTKEVAAALADATTEAWAYAGAAAGAGGKVDGFAVAQAALSDALTSTGEEGEKLTEALGAIGQQSSDAFSIMMNIANVGDTAFFTLAEQAGFAGNEVAAVVEAMNIPVDAPLGGARAAETIERIAAILGVTTEEAMAFVAENRNVVNGLVELKDQADPEVLEDMAQEYLNTASAASESAERLVDEAEARAASNDTADSSTDTYNELMGILGEMSEEERAAALAALGHAEAVEASNAAVVEQEKVTADALDTMSDLATEMAGATEEAEALRGAMDLLTDKHINAEEAADNLSTTFNDLGIAIAEANEKGEIYDGLLLDNTQTARDWRAEMREAAGQILDTTEARIAEGESVEFVDDVYQNHRRTLVGVADQLGLTEAEAEAYITRLGLTPELVQTSVQIVNDERAKADLTAYIAKIGGVPKNWKTYIEALIDQGAYQHAQSLLRQLAAPRTARISAQVYRTPGGVEYTAAYGGYFQGGKPMFGIMGEAPWDEAIITVGNQANLRKQLQDSRILGPILDALPVEWAGSGGGSGGLAIENLSVGTTGDLPQVYDTLESINFRNRHRVGV